MGVRGVQAFKFPNPAAALLGVCTDLWRGQPDFGLPDVKFYHSSLLIRAHTLRQSPNLPTTIAISVVMDHNGPLG